MEKISGSKNEEVLSHCCGLSDLAIPIRPSLMILYSFQHESTPFIVRHFPFYLSLEPHPLLFDAPRKSVSRQEYSCEDDNRTCGLNRREPFIEQKDRRI